MSKSNPLDHSKVSAAITRSEVLSLSEATNRLAKGMWGSWKAPAAVGDAAAAGLEAPAPRHIGTNSRCQDGTTEQNLNKSLKSFRTGYVPRRACAAKRLWDSALAGEPAVYVVPDNCESGSSQPGLKWPESDVCQSVSPSPQPEWPKSPVRLPMDLLGRLIVPLNTVPDHAIRPTLKAIRDPRLYVMLMTGRLVVKRDEFERWYEADRGKGDWPSQTAQTKGNRRGRPTKQTERLQDAIFALVKQKRWDRTQRFTELMVLLREEGQIPVPSVDTVRRLARRMVVEDGDTRLHQPIRAKRARSGRS